MRVVNLDPCMIQYHKNYKYKQLIVLAMYADYKTYFYHKLDSDLHLHNTFSYLCLGLVNTRPIYT